MKDLSIYFQPVSSFEELAEECLGNSIRYHTEGNFPDIDEKGIALIYCPEFRNGYPELHQSASTGYRECFAKLNTGPSWNMVIYDLGIILPGETINDTYFAIHQVASELIKKDVIPVLVGGTQDLTFALYQGYQSLEQTVNLTCIDSRFDLGLPDQEIEKDGYISQILMNRPCVLFNHSVIGIQMPYVKQSELDLFEKLYFDMCRLGEFNADFKKAEPLLRNTDILSLDLQSVRSSDISGTYYTMPNGFYAEQVCQVVRYAGISDKLTSFGIFNALPENMGETTHHLIAEIIWYFLDGVAARYGDFPVGSKKDYKKFIVHMENYENDLVFYKSSKSGRWWMEVPYPPKQGVKYERHSMVPCNYDDYQRAMENEMPDLWWKTYQKLG